MELSCTNIISRLCCLKPKEIQSREHEPLFADVERQAVNQLIDFFENRSQVNFYEGEPLRALSTLAYSGHFELQRSAAIAFSEVSEADVRPVSREALEPILFLLQSPDFEVLRSASAALGNLAVDPQNKILIVKIGGLEPLIRQMLSPNKEAQCNAVGCITNLATAEENKSKIAKSGALIPLSRLAKSHDIRVQKNATGALLNMTHSPENRMQLVSAGAVRVLVELLDASDPDVRYYSTTAISNIAVDENSRVHLQQTEPTLVPKLIKLMDEQETSIRCQAALALRNLASDDEYQRNIVLSGGLRGLKDMLLSNDSYMVLASVACLRNLSIHPGNEESLLTSGFLMPLVQLLGNPSSIGTSGSDSPDTFNNYGEIATHAISTLRNLSASSDNTKLLLVDYGILPRIYSSLVNPQTSLISKSEMTAALAVLALCDSLKEPILTGGFLDVLIPLTHSISIDVVGNSAAAIGNLSASVSDYSVFINNWYEPEGGLQLYLQNFLSSESEPTFLQIGVWTVLQLVESGNQELMDLIKSHENIPSLLKKINNDYMGHSHHRQDSEYSDDVSNPQSSEVDSNYQVAALIQQVFKSLNLEL
ncbi:Vacuolar protein 8 [Smittium mucronatum]|uniref:Vacuolar protein 8 n=1 Tax=Smittium mucronatum TaxID=133383 RepID=A0A1R0H2H0_9FUNG|nr:Vacuolar protein 8 [Smittium mucronatum]